ncbi:MAG TPA: hypothetical protein DCQ68_18925 [Chryseobacterium indologenes]|nr:hypothetical protein [Chryseobacterium indologenes]
MRIEDLRFGIFLYDTLRDTVITVESKHLQQFLIAGDNFLERYKPIELKVENILQQGFYCGFDGNSTLELKCKGKALKLEIVWIKNKNEFSVFIQNKKTHQIKYLHELQNLQNSLF